MIKLQIATTFDVKIRLFNTELINISMIKDLFVNLNETVTLSLQFIDEDNLPVDISQYQPVMRTSLETSTNVIETIDTNNGITIINAEEGQISIEFNPTSAKGYIPRTSIYQLSLNDGVNHIPLKGKLFIQNSLV